ncbi:hypothetical protein V8G54_006171, partial [Vigna mungo]
PQPLLATPPPPTTPGINISGTSTSFLKRSPNPSLKNPPLIILSHRHSPSLSLRPNLKTQTQTRSSRRPSRTCTRPHLNASSHSTAQASQLAPPADSPSSLAADYQPPTSAPQSQHPPPPSTPQR